MNVEHLKISINKCWKKDGGTSSGQSSQVERAPVTKAGTTWATEQWPSWIKTPGIKSPTVHEWMKEKRQLRLTEELELIHVGEGTRESPGEPHSTGCCRQDPQGMLRLVSESRKGNGLRALFPKQFYSKTCMTWKNSSFPMDRPADIIWSESCTLAPQVMTCPCFSWCDILTKTQEPCTDHEDMPDTCIMGQYATPPRNIRGLRKPHRPGGPRRCTGWARNNRAFT